MLPVCGTALPWPAAARRFAGTKRSRRGAGAPTEARGWGLASREDVADIDRAHATAQDLALRRLSQPIPRPDVDDSRPDFLVGALQYRFGDRGQWRVVFGRELEVPAAAVALSVSWHGRLPNDFMRGVQKAVGVTIDARQVDQAGSPFSEMARQSPDAAAEREGRLQEIIAAVNDRRVLDLVELGIVKAADGSILPRAKEGGQTVTTVADVCKAACGDRLVSCLCSGRDLEWVESSLKPRLMAAKIDLHVVRIDDDNTDAETEETRALRDAMRLLVDDHAQRGRVLPDRDLAGIIVKEGAHVSLSQLIHTPALCVRGVVTATGQSHISLVARDRKMLARLAHDPSSVSLAPFRHR